MRILEAMYSCSAIEKCGEILCETCEHTGPQVITSTATSPPWSLLWVLNFSLWINKEVWVNKPVLYRFSSNEPILHVQEDLTTIFPDPPGASVTVLGGGVATVNRAEMVSAFVEVWVHEHCLVGWLWRWSCLVSVIFSTVTTSHLWPLSAWKMTNVTEEFLTLFHLHEFKFK